MITKQSKNAIKIILAVQLTVLAFCVCFCVKNAKHSSEIYFDLDSMYSDYIEFDNDVWYADDKLIQTQEEIELLYGPFIELPKGSYTITMRYECDYDQDCMVRARSEDPYVKAGNVILSKNQREVSFEITVLEDLNYSFEMVVNYNGKGAFCLQDIGIETNANAWVKSFIGLLFVFLVADLYICFRDFVQRYRNLLFALAGIIFLTSLPLMTGGISNGHDLPFHLMRIEGIAEEIRRGNLPVRLSCLWMDGYGYPVSVYYGDLLLYIPAVLRLAGFSVMEAYKCYVLLINAGTVLISYYCFRKILRDSQIAVVTCLAYCTAAYRLMNIYVRSAVGEYSAGMFFPLIAHAVYNIYTADESEWNGYKRNGLLLAIGMTGLIGTHTLSTEMAIFALALVCVLFLKKTFRKNTVRVFLLAAAQTVALNLYFAVPFLDYYKNVQVKINETVSGGAPMKIQAVGAYLGQYFSFFQSVFGRNSMILSRRMNLTPGIIFMVVLIIGIVLCINRRGNKEIYFFTGFSAFLLFISSDIFPWDFLAAHFKLGNLLAQIQYPWRYINLAVLFLALLLGTVLKQNFLRDNRKQNNYLKAAVLICIVSSCFFVSSYSDHAEIKYYYDTAELSTYSVGMGEYVRTRADRDGLTGDVAKDNMLEAAVITRDGCYMELYCESLEGGGTVEVPLFNYKGYRVTDETGVEYEVMDGENDVIKFMVSDGFKGTIVIDFVEPWYWRIAEIVSLLTILLAATVKAVKKRENRQGGILNENNI